ncbi:MAG: hypothetical protein L0Z62_09350 [Gemmataceae bacterium]|nr:hypothetical protein [Gemmataceae bacterium]
MRHIVLTEEQSQIIAQADGPVEVRDNKGRTVGRLTPFNAAEVEAIARAKQNLSADGPLIPAAEVHAHLLKLEEISKREGLDAAKARELLRRMRAGEEGT